MIGSLIFLWQHAKQMDSGISILHPRYGLRWSQHRDKPPLGRGRARGRTGGHATAPTSDRRPAVPSDGPFWSSLCQLTLGEPARVVSGDDSTRFRFLFTRVGCARVLHVIDAAVPAKDYQPKAVEVSLAARHLGPRCQATLAGSGQAVAILEKDGRLHFTVRPAPVATVVLQRAK